MKILDTINYAWLKVRSNAYFIAFEGAALGALASGIEDELQSGHIDWTPAGWHKLLTMSVAAGVTAVRALYRPQPNAITIPVAQPPTVEPASSKISVVETSVDAKK